MHKIQLTIVRKSIRLQRFIKHNLFDLFNYKLSNYENPPDFINEIGFFNKDRKIHIKNNYHHLFDNKNIQKSGSFNYLKEKTISIVEIDGKPLIKKKYFGFYKNDKFYNEIICLDRLNNIKQTPNINYIDYKNKTIYIEYISGLNLYKNNYLNLSKSEKDAFFINFKKIINLIHENKIAIVDVGGQNMIIKDSDYYIIDFADSLYFSNKFNLFNPLFEYFALLDILRFENRFK